MLHATTTLAPGADGYDLSRLDQFIDDGEDRIVKDREGARMYGRSRSWFWAKVKAGVLPPPIVIDGATGWSHNILQADIRRRIADASRDGFRCEAGA